MLLNGEPVPTEFRLVASAVAGHRRRRARAPVPGRLLSAPGGDPDRSAAAARSRRGHPGAGRAAAGGSERRRDGRRRTFTQTALALLGALTWPGNLAELRAAIDRVVKETSGEVIQIEQMLPALQLDRAPTPFVPAGNLRDARLRFERDYIAAVLQHCGWRMAEAAQALGIQRPNLYRKARQLGIPVTRVPEQLS